MSRPPFFTALAFWDTRFHSKLLRWTEKENAKPAVLPNKGSIPEIYRKQLVFNDGEQFWSGSDQAPTPSGRSSPLGDLVLYRDRSHPDFYSLDEELLEADWADIDHRGRVLFTRGGHVFMLDENGERELIDLTPLAFETVKPPAWARNWPRE